MLPKWVYPLLITFVVFFVLSSPESAGPQARSFFSWVGDQASSAATFLDGLFGNDPATDGPSSSDGFETMRPIIVLDVIDLPSVNAPTVNMPNHGRLVHLV